MTGQTPSPARRHPARLEQLERRLLLSATPMADPPMETAALIGHDGPRPPAMTAAASAPQQAEQPPLPNGLLGAYYDDTGFADLAGVRIEPVGFDFGTAPPLPGMGPDTYSIRWSGQIVPDETAEYTFTTLTDDGVRLFIDGQPVIGDWQLQPATENQATVRLEAGQAYDIRLDYFNNLEGGTAQLLWSNPTLERQVVPAQNLRPASPTVADVIIGDYRILAEPVDDGTFRISATPSPDIVDPAAPGRFHLAELASPGGVTLRLDRDAEEIVLLDGGETLWRGTLGEIENYGRAAVPGTEITWDAQEGERIFGLGERFDTLNQAGRFVVQWIEDIPGQDLGRASYYTAPLVYNPDVGYGLFIDDDPEGDFNFNALGTGENSYRRAEQDVVFLLAEGDTMAELIAKRTDAIGGLQTLPDWAWGPWISRNSFETQYEAMAAVQGHVDRDLPVNAIVLEAWKGTSEAGDFNNFSPDRFPDLDTYFAFMELYGVETILWQVPLIFPVSPLFDEAAENGYFVRGPDGEIRLREAWLPGSANVDFTNPAAVDWYQDLIRDEVRRGVAGFKTDDGEDIAATDVFSDGSRGWELHNEYAALYNQAVYDVFREEGVDGLVWARSGSLGRERTPAQWAGDQVADWRSLDSLLVAGLSSGISGAPFWSHDIGGYLGDPEPELYRRWTQFGAWSPLMQYHGISPREPWLFGEDSLENYRLNVELRMNLYPYFIEQGRTAAATGLPIMRPMFLVYPEDPAFRGDYTQYMLGEDVLVAPITTPGLEGRYVQFPEGQWVDPVTNQVYGQGSHFVRIGQIDAPIFLRVGAELRVNLPSEFDQLRPFAWDEGLPTRTITVAQDANRPVIMPEAPGFADTRNDPNRNPPPIDGPDGNPTSNGAEGLEREMSSIMELLDSSQVAM